MPITEDSKEKLKHRLVKAMGHLNAVHRMVEEQRYCIDVLHQLKAVQAALDKTAEEILKQHLETCVVEAVRNQDEKRVIDELVQVFRRAPQLDVSREELSDLFQKQSCCSSKSS
jgi:DNA-binding FrmR family transcriptional regulator